MNEDDVLRDALAGIKTKRTRRRVSKFNPEDGLLFEADEGKVYVPGKGIVQVHEVKEKILDCGHSASLGLGHIAECGHTVCALCIERFVLECAEPGCFKKLCTVHKCICSARNIEGIFFCKRHSFWASVGFFTFNIFMRRESREKLLDEMIEGYYSRRIRLRGEK